MIFIGYQGVGKSTLAYTNINFIDLESSNFWIDGKRDEEWYKPYCKIADNLSHQGYHVFLSSHKVVRDYLKEHTNQATMIVLPDLSLKDKWIEKLKKRYEVDPSDKNYKAYMNAKECYEENIIDLMNDKYDHITISSMDYNLENILETPIQLNSYISFFCRGNRSFVDK